MKKIMFVLGLWLCVSVVIFANLAASLDEVDRLHDLQRYEDSVQLLNTALRQASTNQQRAEVYWRLARATLNMGNELKDAEAPQAQTLAKYEEGEAFADKAIEADPQNHQGYFWKSSNIGMWGQTRGVLNALFKARPMRELLEKAVSFNNKHADSFYVLGQLYRELPGGIISFGDSSKAVSYGRLSVELNRQDFQRGDVDHIYYDFHTELAKSLWDRGLNASRRNREHASQKRTYDRANTAIDRGAAYEGSITINTNVTDKEEALQIIRNVIRQLENTASRTLGQNDDLKKAREVLAEWE